MLLSQLEINQMVRNTVTILFYGLNDEIDRLNADWAERDSEFFSMLGRDNPEVVCELVAETNFYFGHVPSLLEAPIEKYPNVAVMSPNATPIATNDDHAEKANIRLWIEIMAKAQGDDDDLAAEAVNNRLMRMGQAVQVTMKAPPARTLNGIVPKLGQALPLITNGDVFVRRAEKGRGPRWFWQGARLEYIVEQWISL